MTVKRDKQNRRVLRYYRIAFGIEAPYSVLVDGNFLHAAGGKNLEVEERLQKLLNSRKVNVLVTRCTCHELQALGEACGAAAAYASTLKRQKCGHPREPEGAGDCIASLVGSTNRHKYVVATQDMSLRKRLRLIPGVPLVYLNRTALVLEAASASTTSKSDKAEYSKLAPLKAERRALQSAAQAAQAAQAAAASSSHPTKRPRKNKPKGPRQPNPLSMRKAAPTQRPGPGDSAAGAKGGASTERKASTASVGKERAASAGAPAGAPVDAPASRRRGRRGSKRKRANEET